MQVYCDMETEGGGWSVFQRRKDGTVGFYRGWDEYDEGFGELNGEFWLGLKKIHRLTNQNYTSKLRVDLEDFDNNVRYAEYSNFSIGNSSTDYEITSGEYSGTAGDSLLLFPNTSLHLQLKFSTRDRDNDLSSSENCAKVYRGAWWYSSCHEANLNGLYLFGATCIFADGIIWYKFRQHHYSLKFSEMKVKVIKV